MSRDIGLGKYIRLEPYENLTASRFYKPVFMLWIAMCPPKGGHIAFRDWTKPKPGPVNDISAAC